MSDELFRACRECTHKTNQKTADGDVICLNCKLVTPTVNGCLIIKKLDTPAMFPARAGRVILADRGSQHSDRWVTAWQGRDLVGPDTGWDGEWCWGHYFDDVTEAEADFKARSERGH